MLRDTLVATFAAMLVVAAYFVSEATPRLAHPAPDEMIRTSLDTVVAGEHHFTGTVRQAVEWLESRGVPIRVSWPRQSAAAESWAIPTARKLRLRLRDATVDQWLSAIAFQSRGSMCHYCEPDGAIRISSRQGQQPPLVVRVYDVRDLLAEAHLTASLFPVTGAWAGDWSPPTQDADEAARYALEEWVKRSVREWNWEYVGSGSAPAFARIGFIDGRMTVVQTPSAQREIEVTLAALRARRAGAFWRGQP
jgi:hypothetical protein